MKTLKSFLIIAFIALLIAVFIAPPLAQAQQALSPNGQQLYYTYNMTGASYRAYVKNTIDTLPNSAINTWYLMTTQSATLGGASRVSLQLIVLDSASADVYVDELIGSTWTNIIADSLITTSNTGKTQEYIIRNYVAESTTHIGGKYRARISWRNVTMGVSTATYKGSFLWKP